MKIMPKVLLCYASEDEEKVLGIYERLVKLGLRPQMAPDDVGVGQLWKSEIQQMLKEADFVLICCSNIVINKTSPLQWEITEALENLKERPPKAVYVLPARIEPCDLQERLSDLQSIDLFDGEYGWTRLVEAVSKEMRRREVVTEVTGLGSNQEISFYDPKVPNDDNPITSPWASRVKDLATDLTAFFSAPAGSLVEPHLVEMFSSIERLLIAVRNLRQDQGLIGNLEVRFLSSFLNRAIEEKATQFKKLKEHHYCTLSSNATSAALASAMLSTHMGMLKPGDRYDVISDLTSWRDHQLREFRDTTQEAVSNGVLVQRVFNLMLPEPDQDPLSVRAKLDILRDHIADAEVWNKESGTYAVRVFSKSDVTNLSLGANKPKPIREAHFGIFRHGTDLTAMEYDVEEYDLSEMRVWTDRTIIDNRLSIFDLIWHASPQRTLEEIQRLPELAGHE